MLEIPQVTVLMPVFNGEKYLGEAVASILGQTFSNFELLIIDDGSTDSSREVIASFPDRRIHLICNSGNLGIGASLNRGLQLARGEFVARMDCDDISIPTRLNKQVEYLKSHPAIAACGTWLKTFGTNAKEWKFPLHHEDIRAKMLFVNSFPHAPVMMRKAVLLSNGLCYQNIFPGAEDYDLWVRLMRKEKLANLPEYLYLYRQYDQQTTYVKSDLKTDSGNRIRRAILEAFGIEMSEDEFNLHCKIALNLSGYSLEEARTWLEKIERANCQQQYFDHDALRKVLGRFWFACCLRKASHGLRTRKEYLGSFLSLYEPLNFQERIRFFAKCALRR